MIDDLDSNAELYPSWRQALVCFREAGFKPGDIIPHTWFYEQFDCAALLEPKKISADQFQALRLKLLGQFTPFREALLEQEQVDLQSVPGVGYEIVPPADQTTRALKDTLADIEKAWRSGWRRGANVRLAELTTEQRREHADDLARFALLHRQLKAPRELPPPDDV